MKLQASQDGVFQSDQKRTREAIKKKEPKTQTESDLLAETLEERHFFWTAFLKLLVSLSKRKRGEVPLQVHQTDHLRQLNKFEKGKMRDPSILTYH